MNLATLCPRCHKAQDYATWAPQYRAWLERRRQERIDERDAARPILVMLRGVAAEDAAVSGGAAI